MKKILIAVCLASISIANAQEVARTVTATNGKKIGFYEFKPKDYSSSKKYPLIIFLHGIGERGNGTTDISRVNANAIPRLIRGGNAMTFSNPNTGKKETFIVLCPQLDKSYGSWQNFHVDEMLKYAKKNLSIDKKRVFLTGLSLGGGGVWKYATASEDNAAQFAGIIDCCGTGEGTYFCNIADAKTAVWAFHAMDDGTVGVGNTQYAQMKLSQCNPKVKAKFTYYASGGHGIWERAFDPGHGFQNPNVYEWMLSLSSNNGKDNDSKDEDDESGKTPANKLPVANAGTDQVITLPANSVPVNGSASSDADGTIVKYEWSKVSGPAATIVSASSKISQITKLTSGTYVFQLKVTDNAGGVAYDNVTVSVNAAPVVNNKNKSPVANAGNNFSTSANFAYLSGGASYDPDGSLVKFAWKQVSGPNNATISGGDGMFPTVKNLIRGVYVFQFTVTDNKGASASASVSLTVTSTSNKPPIANAGNDLKLSLPLSTVKLDGSLSYDPDGSIASYAWSKISGPAKGNILSPTSKTTQLINLATGIYVFQLKITDNGGKTDVDEVTIIVTGNSNNNKPPYCNAGDNFSSANNYVYLSGGASYDLDGSIVSFVWTEISGPNKPSVIFGNTMFPILQNLVPGTYVYKLTVTDNDGASASSQVTFIITGGKKTTASSSLSEAKIATENNEVSTTDISISPIPAKGYINLAINNELTGKLKVVIYDATGKTKKTIEYNKTQFDFRQQIDITSFTQGVYYLQIMANGKTLPVQRFVKMQ